MNLSLIRFLCLIFALGNILNVANSEEKQLQIHSLEDEINYLTPSKSINLDARLSTYANSNRRYGVRQSYVSISGEIEEQIRAVITLNIGHLFSSGELAPNQNFSLSQFVREAYIEIRNYKGKPYAFVVGKRPITFGLNLEQMPFFERNPLYREMFIQDVYGFTVELTEGLLGALDNLEFTVYERKRNDLLIEEVGNYAFRGQKYISKQALINIGYSSESTKIEEVRKRRFNVGIVGTSKNGKVLAWLEGIMFNDRKSIENFTLGVNAGITYLVTKKTKLIVESNIIQNTLYQIGLGAKVNLTKNLALGLEARFTLFPSNTFETFYGLNLTHLIDTELYKTSSSEPTIFEGDYEL